MIGAIVLAAGASTRMGRAKATLTVGLDGPTFIDAIVATLRPAGIDPIRVVVAPGGAHIDAAHIVNPDPMRGMLSSVHCGLAALPHGLEAVFVWPVDHPLVQQATIAAMIAAFRKTGAPIIVPTHGGRRGHPVLLAARVFPELVAADPAVGARAVVHAHDDRIELPVDDRGVGSDINTREDYVDAFGAAPHIPPETP